MEAAWSICIGIKAMRSLRGKAALESGKRFCTDHGRTAGSQSPKFTHPTNRQLGARAAAPKASSPRAALVCVVDKQLQLSSAPHECHRQQLCLLCSISHNAGMPVHPPTGCLPYCIVPHCPHLPSQA